VAGAAHRWYGDDTNYPAGWEPNGGDFLSPALTETELMSEVLQPAAFADWLDRFLPGLANGHPSSLFEPAIVSDPTDGQIVHLHGLNLYRAADWRLRGLHLDPGSGRMVPETQVGRSALAQRHPPGEGAAAAADRCV